MYRLRDVMLVCSLTILLCTKMVLADDSAADDDSGDAPIGLYFGKNPNDQYVFRSSTELEDPRNGECGESEHGFYDKVFVFKFEGVNTKVKITDPKVYADGGSKVLLDWISEMQRKGALNDVGMDQYTNAIVTTRESELSGGSRTIRACVGSTILGQYKDDDLKRIYLWYSMKNINPGCKSDEYKVWDGDNRKWKCVKSNTDSDPQDGGGNTNGNGNNTTNNTPPPQEIITPGHYGGGGLNDMSLTTMSLSKGSHSKRHKTLTQKPKGKFYAYMKLKNTGSATAHDFKAKFYIDGGKKNFNGDHEDYQDSVRIDSFQPGAEIRYAIELTAPKEPGVYWVYGRLTSLEYDENTKNNGSKESKRRTYGKLIVTCSDDGEMNINLVPSGMRVTNTNTVYENQNIQFGSFTQNTGYHSPCTKSRLSY